MQKVLNKLDELIDMVEAMEKGEKKPEKAKKVNLAGMAAGKKNKEVDLGQYWKKPKLPESEAPTITYSSSGVKRTPGSKAAEDGFKAPKPKSPGNQALSAKLKDQRVSAGIKKCDEELSELLSKAEKDELFPEPSMKAPMTASYTPDKECAANDVFYAVTRLAEIKRQSYDAHDHTDEVKAAYQYLYDKQKEKLKDAVAVYKKAKEAKPAKAMYKSEAAGIITPEALTNTILAKHSVDEVTMMLKTAVDSGKIHRNILLEWSTFKTLNPQLVNLIDEE